MLLEREEVTTPLPPMLLVMALIGGITFSKVYEPDPHLWNFAWVDHIFWITHDTHPVTIVPSLHLLRSQLGVGIFASCPMTAIVLGWPRGRPRDPDLLFFNKTAEAAATSRARAM